MDAEMIDKLAFGAGIHQHSMNDPVNPDLNGWIVSPEKLDKFAELIVKECAHVALMSNGNNLHVFTLIKDQFGVE